jgi:membrane fusion protein (multidrug efflux system)
MSADGGNTKVVEMKAPDTALRPAPAAAPPAPAPAPPKRNRFRYAIMAIVPLILIAVGAYWWLTGGRYASTDNAYVRQDKVTVTADVSGRIVDVEVGENQRVNAGDLLFRIDPAPYRITLAGAEAALASARLQVEQLRAAYEQAVAEEKTATDDLAFKQKAFDRQKGLLAKGIASQATYEEAENDLHAAQDAQIQGQQRTQSARAALGGDPSIATDTHPMVLAALAKRDQAALDLKNTEARAPISGVIAQSGRLQVGGYVTSPAMMPTPMLSIVETGDSYVEANFKETDLTNMKIGQKATVSVDAYPGHSYEGEVASIGAGTGAEFAVLPAQNATGNWIKVVQRVPVRIHFAAPVDIPLRSGLSASVSVDTKSPVTAAGLITTPAAAAAKAD